MPPSVTEAFTWLALGLALAVGLTLANVIWLFMLGSLFFPRSLDRWVSSLSERTLAKVIISAGIYLAACVVLVTVFALVFGRR